MLFRRTQDNQAKKDRDRGTEREIEGKKMIEANAKRKSWGLKGNRNPEEENPKEERRLAVYRVMRNGLYFDFAK